MEGVSNQEKSSIDAELQTKLLLHTDHAHKGGLRTMPFIIVNEAFERVASFGLLPNMIFYLMEVYHMEVVSATSLLSIWSALSNGLTIFGAFIADSYLGRFRVIAIGSLSTILGMIFLWLTSMFSQLTPSSSKEGFAVRLISLYGKSGMFDHASKVFDEMPERICSPTPTHI